MFKQNRSPPRAPCGAHGERVVPVSEEVGWVIVCVFLPASVFSAYLLDLTFLFRSPEGPPLIFLLFLLMSFSATPPALLVLFGRALLPHTLTHFHIKQNYNDVAARQRNLARFKTKTKIDPFARRLSCVVCRGCRLSCVAGREFAPLIFLVAFGPQISGPPVPRCGFCGVEAEGKGRKGKRKERKEREKNGKRTSQRAFFGCCVLLLVGFWVRRGARDV